MIDPQLGGSVSFKGFSTLYDYMWQRRCSDERNVCDSRERRD